MKVLELFSGTECISNAFRAKGHECFTIDYDEQFPSSWHADISKVTTEDILERFGIPDVVWCGTDCFVAGTLVMTKYGYKNIEDIQCGDYVLTHNGNYKKVYRTMKESHTNMYGIKIAGSELLKCTSNHPFYARKKKYINTHRNGEVYTATVLENPEWILAEKLSNEYRVGIPINKNSIIPKWDGVVRYKCNEHGVYLSYIENNISKLLTLKEFWWFVGRYIGDGYISIVSDTTKKTRYEIDLCCSVDEIDEIKPYLNTLGFKYYEKTQNTTHHFTMNSKELHQFLEQFGHGAKNKKITTDILNLPVELLKEFCDGYISADGHWDDTLKNPCCTISTISRQLAYGMQHCILKAYGKYCSLFCNENNSDVICGRKVNVNPSYVIGFYKNESNRLQYTIENNMAWVNVKDVSKLPTKTTTTYNMSVEDDESYTVNNISVHNCTSYSIAAISHHRKRNPETGNLDGVSDYAKFCDAMNWHVREMIEELQKLNPNLIYIWENPRGGFRKMDFIQGIPRYTTTYCQYGDTRMKPSDFFSNVDLKLKPPCHNGDPCHMAAPRGSRTGTQGLKSARERSMYPHKLCEHIVDICEEHFFNN